MAIAIVSYLFVQGCRRCYLDRFAWLLSQSLLAHIAADDCGARIFAFSLNKREASPESGNRQIHASLSCRLVLLLSIAIIARF